MYVKEESWKIIEIYGRWMKPPCGLQCLNRLYNCLASIML